MKIKHLVLIGLLLGATCANAVVIQTTDFIADGNRTNFNGFEGLPNSYSYGSTYTEDGITVTQANGQSNDIWATCTAICFPANSSTRAWYPNGGDFGWTEITRAGGLDFYDIGLTLGTGNNLSYLIRLQYELLNDGVSVLAGTYDYYAGQYFGFSDGGFDQVRLRSFQVPGFTLGFGNVNSLAIDDIELAGSNVSVPEPSTAGLFCMGLALFGFLLRRKRLIAVE